MEHESPYKLPSDFKQIYYGIFTEDPLIIGMQIIRPKTPFDSVMLRQHIEHLNQHMSASPSQLNTIVDLSHMLPEITIK